MPQDLMYVRFEQDTGKILGISPKPSSNHHDIQVTLDEVIGILDGKEKKRNYAVEYDPKKKQLCLVNRHEKHFDGVSVNDFIYEIPENTENDVDVTIIQDVTNQCWKILLGKTLSQNLKKQGVRLNRKLTFSVTAKHDPNILYKTLSTDFTNIVRDNYSIIPFSMNFENNDSNISVFTAKIFDTYSFQRDTNVK